MMIRVTVDLDGETAAIVWTPEYGFTAAGAHALLDAITYEEIEPQPRTAAADVIPLTAVADVIPLTAVPGLTAAEIEHLEAEAATTVGKVCVTCGHPDTHTDTGCTANGCECYTAVYA